MPPGQTPPCFLDSPAPSLVTGPGSPVFFFFLAQPFATSLTPIFRGDGNLFHFEFHSPFFFFDFARGVGSKTQEWGILPYTQSLHATRLSSLIVFLSFFPATSYLCSVFEGTFSWHLSGPSFFSLRLAPLCVSIWVQTTPVRTAPLFGAI